VLETVGSLLWTPKPFYLAAIEPGGCVLSAIRLLRKHAYTPLKLAIKLVTSLLSPFYNECVQTDRPRSQPSACLRTS
jgi:hypothetical protein